MWEQFIVKRLRSGYTSNCIYKFKKVSTTYSLDLRRIGGQTRGQSSRAVSVIIKPANLLAQHGLETKPP